MKKLVSLLLTVCMCLSIGVILTACGEEHTHTYKTEWSKDTTHHWHACEGEDCSDVADKAEHNTENGTCSVCGYVVSKSDDTSNGNGTSNNNTTTITYTVTESEWSALFSGNTFKNLTAKITSETYANDVLSASATKYRVVKIAENSLYKANTTANYTNFGNEVYLTSKGGVWYYLTKEETVWYGVVTDDPTHNVETTHVFDYIFNETDFSAKIGQYGEFTYDEGNKCYTRDLGTISNMYHYTMKLYFENGALAKIEYIAEWTNDGYEFKNVQTAVFSDYGTVTLTIPDWTTVTK